MFGVIVTEKGGSTERHEFEQNEVTIGRVQGNDIILGKGNVSKRHSRLVLKDGRFIVVDLKSTNGTYVNGRKVTSPIVVKPGDKIYIGDFTLTIEGGPGTSSSMPAMRPIGEPAAPQPAPTPAPQAAPLPPPAPPAPRVEAAVPAQVMPSSGPPPAPFTDPQAPRPSPPPASSSSPLGTSTGTSSHEFGKQAKTWEPPKRAELFEGGRPIATPRPPLHEIGSRGAPTKHTSAYEALALVIGDRNLRTVMQRLEADLDIHEISAEAMRDSRRWTDAESRVERIIQRLMAESAIDEVDPTALAASAVREAVGLGVLEGLLADERVREILVSAPGEVWVDYGQGPERASSGFSDGRMMLTVLRRLASQAGIALDRSVAVHQFLLPAGSHVTVVLPPVATNGPIVEIRRVHAGPSLDDMVASHALAPEARTAIVRAVQAGRTVAVVGPTGSGVTTMLCAIADVFPARERVVVASAIADLRLERANTVALAAGIGPHRPTFREVIGQAARLRSDRLLLDGVSGEELAVALAHLSARKGGDVLGVRTRLGESSTLTLRHLLERQGVASDEAAALVTDAIALVVELDEAHGLRRVRRVVDLASSNRVESGEPA